MFMLGDCLRSDQSLKHDWKDLEEINAYLPLAFIASEDQRFLQHHGFDLDAIEKAFHEIQSGQRFRGGSTISQQVAKNLFLYREQTYLRKGLEAYFTVLIELLWSKDRIMEVYLNIVELGDLTYGVSAAAEEYFSTTAQNINQYQAALMATALPSPISYSLSSPSPYMKQRSKWVLRQMDNLGGLRLLESWY